MNKWLNRAIIAFQYAYETRIAPFLALYFWFPWWPLYLWAKRRNICFVINIAEGTGQVLPELDNFFHMLHLGEIDQKKKYIWIRTRNNFSKALIPLYRTRFHYAAMSNVLYDLALPALLIFHDITHDAGMAGLHWQLPKDGNWKYPKPWQTFLYMDEKQDVLPRWRDWYRRRLYSNDFMTLESDKLSPSQELLNFLDDNISNIVLIHIKTNIMNATARVTDASTYIPAIDYLQLRGYRLVFVGREKMPKEFYNKNILNYSESSIASFLYDLQIFSLAKFSITGGSGIAWIADCLRKPVLYLNSWHLFMPPAGKYCIFVPTLVKDKKNEQLLSFTEQYALYLHTPADYGDTFPFGEYEPVNTTAEDIVCATQELESALKHYVPILDNQKKFATLVQNSWTQFAQSRISSKFLSDHADLLQ